MNKMCPALPDAPHPQKGKVTTMNDNFDPNTGLPIENETPSFEPAAPQEPDAFSFAQSEPEAPQQPQPEPQPTVPPTPQSFQQPTQNVYQGYGQQNGYRPAYHYGSPQQQQQQPYRPYGYNQAPQPPKKSKGTGKKVAIAVLLIAVIVGFAAIVGSKFWKADRRQPVVTDSNGVTISQQSGENKNGSDKIDDVNVINYASAEDGVLSAVAIAKKCRISVVGVMTYQNGKLSGEGSGVVMGTDKEGKYTYIITCAHVVKGSGLTYGILTLDEKRYEASLVAYDERTDIGVLKVEANDLTAAEFGDSSKLEVGETVYAIGNPGGSEYFGSITNGIVSAIDRSVSSTYTLTSIQHNAAINPGNSGGALVNSKGQVVGINSSKIAATDYEGMGFAVPMSTVKPIVESLIKYHYVPNRPKLGIQYASVSSYQMYSMVVAIKGLPAGSLVIAGISNDSSLANTEAQVGDLIIAVNGKDMDDSSVLLDLIDKGAVGDTMTLTLCRVENRTYKTTTFDVTITLVEDKGTTEEPTTTAAGGYNYGGASSFEDFFRQYFGDFGF